MSTHGRRLLRAGSLVLTAGLAAALVVAGSGASAYAAEPLPELTLPGQCVTNPQYVADGISLGCTVTGAPAPDNPNAPEQGNYVHTATIDLTAAGVLPQVVQSNDRIFQPVGTPAGTNPEITNETVTSMANRSGAVVGVNGGYFDNDKGPLLADVTPQPFSGVVCGGVVIDGQVWKSPPNNADLNASIFVNADGTMGIGQVYFDASIQVVAADGSIQDQHALDSVNTLGDGVPQPGCPKDHAEPTTGTGITLITPDMGDVVLNASYNESPDSQYILPASAAAVEVRAHADGSGGYVVDAVALPGRIAEISGLAPGQIILLASQSDVENTAGFWLKNSIEAGDTLGIPQALAVGDGSDRLQLGAEITSLVGGVGQIASGGQILPAGNTPFPRGTNAETVVGLDESGTAVTLAVIDKVSGTNTSGDVEDSPGVTWQQAAQTVIDLGASEAILLDGGGSSTLVAQLGAPAIGPSGPSRVTVTNTQDGANNYPNGDFNQRLVANGLFFSGNIAGPVPTPAPSPVPATPAPAADGPALAATGGAPAAGVAFAGLLLLTGIVTTAGIAARRRVL
ncbi:phosphodiester glycosidase family protein [Herbiconiux sp.]|uniref:phosphodiester glycosidase family protein n=1 Tax=Herbiconiux sp. TaxID=1871186 RepID=UPI0025C151AB|nr:phosphodiester glycosidase family protein [Herbiconiux sp.]